MLKLNNKGFTLVELTLVMIVLSLLWGVSLRAMNPRVETAKCKATAEELDEVREATRLYYKRNGAVPGTVNDLISNGYLGVLDGGLTSILGGSYVFAMNNITPQPVHPTRIDHPFNGDPFVGDFGHILISLDVPDDQASCIALSGNGTGMAAVVGPRDNVMTYISLPVTVSEESGEVYVKKIQYNE